MDKILLGHTCQDNAFYVNDYPYSWKLRCKIRYWIETATVGAKKGEMRFVSQTTNPKKGQPDYWNKPSPSIYSPLLVMVQREDNGHIESRGLSLWSTPEQVCLFEVMVAMIDLPPAMPTDEPAEHFHTLCNQVHSLKMISRKYNKDAWAKFDAEKAKASGYVSDATV